MANWRFYNASFRLNLVISHRSINYIKDIKNFDNKVFK